MYSNIGFQLAAEGKPEMAVDALIRAGSTGYQDASPRDLRLVSEQLALNLLKLGRVDPAIAVYQQMLARDDLDNTTRRNLSFLLSRQGRNEEALQAMQRVVHDEPHDWAAWYNCASLKAVIGTYDNASILADLRNAVERNRDEASKQFVEDTLLREKLKGDPGLKEILGEEIYLQAEKPTSPDETSGN
jgi:tetratricopeptide (TPR) repeat protein